MKQERVIEFDCARALAMLYIVGFWHLRNYSVLRLESIDYAERIAEIISLGALGTFTFISAFFLSKNKINTKIELFNFYKKRWMRLYPLFFISCLTLFLMSTKSFDVYGNKIYFENIYQFIFTILGLGCFANTPPRTVWYASMIIFLWGYQLDATDFTFRVYAWTHTQSTLACSMRPLKTMQPVWSISTRIAGLTALSALCAKPKVVFGDWPRGRSSAGNATT